MAEQVKSEGGGVLRRSARSASAKASSILESTSAVASTSRSWSALGSQANASGTDRKKTKESADHSQERQLIKADKKSAHSASDDKLSGAKTKRVRQEVTSSKSDIVVAPKRAKISCSSSQDLDHSARLKDAKDTLKQGTKRRASASKSALSLTLSKVNHSKAKSSTDCAESSSKPSTSRSKLAKNNSKGKEPAASANTGRINAVETRHNVKSSKSHHSTESSDHKKRKKTDSDSAPSKVRKSSSSHSQHKANSKTGLSKSKAASSEVPAADASFSTPAPDRTSAVPRRRSRSDAKHSSSGADQGENDQEPVASSTKAKATGSCTSSRKSPGASSKGKYLPPADVSSQATSSLLALMADIDGDDGGGSAGGSRPPAPPSLAPGRFQDLGSVPDNATGLIASAASLGAMSTESESEEADMSRLQALLEARGLPSHWFGALGPRMQQLLQRSVGNSSILSKAHQLLQGLQSSDEGQQLSSAIEMCQLLVMGNEDTLAGFPVKQAVPALIGLLHADHNFDIMHHACRALTYMMEVLPRSSVVVVEAIPVLLEKLQVIQCMDVAEQALQGLEMLSRRHGKAILHAGGVGACLTYVDFFSMPAQRAALAVSANCCQGLGADDYHYVRDSIAMLSTRLTQLDKKALDSVCLLFARLVDSYQNDERVLREIAAHGLLPNVQTLLMSSPPLLNTGTFVMVVRMMVVMCATCPDLAIVLLKQNVADAICFLLLGSQQDQGAAAQSMELVSRTPQEMYEIVCLIGELMPRLPSDGIFVIDNVVQRSSQRYNDAVLWQWRDDRNIWHAYTPIDSRIIEAAYQSGEDEVGLATMGRSYVVDFNTMQQINEDSGTVRPVQRKAAPAASATANSTAGHSLNVADGSKVDSRAVIMQENPQVVAGFVKTLFAVLYEVYNSSTGPSVRHRCLQALLRMLYYSSSEVLRDVLSNINTGSHIATMMASNDLKVVVAALQMAEVLMEKLTDVFSVQFRREGVVHQVRRLMEPRKMDSSQMSDSPGPSQPILVTASPPQSLHSHLLAANSVPIQVAAIDIDKPSSSSQMKISEVFKRKKAPTKTSSKKGAKMEESEKRVATSDGSGVRATSPTPPARTRLGSKEKVAEKMGKEKTSSSLRLPTHPSRWGRLSPSASTAGGSTSAAVSDFATQPIALKQEVAAACVPSSVSLLVGQKERVKEWIRERAKQFVEKYFADEVDGAMSPGLSILSRLHQATCALGQPSHDIGALREISAILAESDVSPFEILHSGLIGRLIHYLTDDLAHDRNQHIVRFLHVFANCPEPPTQVIRSLDRSQTPPLLSMLSKLLACLHHLEQFQVKVHELPGGGSTAGRGTSALRFFNTHQLKCSLQRHPQCTSLRQWKGGPVKVDPLALVSAIERCLIMRGYSRSRQEPDDLEGSDDDNSDDDIDDTMAAVSISQGISQHRLEFLIGDHVLPYNMTVYQAIRQHGSGNNDPTDSNETDNDTDHPFGNAGIWVRTHTIWYRPVSEGASADSSLTPKKSKSSDRAARSSTSRTRKDPLWAEGLCPQLTSALEPYLVSSLPGITVTDPSMEVIVLLRILHALNKYWHTMYETTSSEQPVSSQEFVSAKLTAKANRQLQDPLIIMTGNIPHWLGELGHVCSFLLPFETRQMLFYATSFDRDRAMQRLQDTTVDSGHTDAADRVAPRLEKKKKVISRDDVLKHAEKVLEDIGNSRAILEIHYDNEVGTGLGPTLEFYALVSQELQRADLDLWRGEAVPMKGADGHSKDSVAYVFSPCGLYPAPLGRHAKTTTVNRVRSKFRFLGCLMAKALMDSRVLDLPLSVTMYKWMLGEEGTLSSADLHHIDASLARSCSLLEDIVRQKKKIDNDPSYTAESRQLALDNLTMDGCSVQDLGLDFVLPGYPQVELKKGGKDIPVTLDSLEEYLKLVLHWTMVEGVRRQMESFKEGFETLIPLSRLSSFYAEELAQLFCGSQQETWDIRYLLDCCRTDHGYTHDSRVVRLFFDMLASYDGQQQRRFLQFVTGSPRLPVGGLRSLNPPLTIVRKTCEGDENADLYLPSVMTCVNYLKLPEYSSFDVMKAKVDTAIRDGQLSFHLS